MKSKVVDERKISARCQECKLGFFDAEGLRLHAQNMHPARGS